MLFNVMCFGLLNPCQLVTQLIIYQYRVSDHAMGSTDFSF